MQIQKFKNNLYHFIMNYVYAYNHRRIPKLCETNPTKAVKLSYFNGLGKYPNLKTPTTINEKLQVLKLEKYYNNDIVTICVDKYKVKEYLTQKGMGQLCATLYGVYDTFEDINWSLLPNSFVIKCNHGCGYNILCKEKDKLDLTYVKNLLDQWMAEDCWKIYAEFQYRFVEKKIIIEEYLGDRVRSYKFYCFHGEPMVIYTSLADEEGNPDVYLDYFNTNWQKLDITLGDHKHYPDKIEEPSNLQEMLDICKTLSRDFPFVRIDLFNVDNKIYFSEFTFMPTGGYMHFVPEETATEWGNWLHL